MLEQRVRQEIEALHAFFVGWFSGALAPDAFEEGFLRRFDSDLLLIPPDNGRVATVLFRETEPLRWLHIHETWLPESVQSAGPYDF